MALREMVPNSSYAIAYSVPPSWAYQLSTDTDSPFPCFPAFCSVLTKARLNREKHEAPPPPPPHTPSVLDSCFSYKQHTIVCFCCLAGVSVSYGLLLHQSHKGWACRTHCLVPATVANSNKLKEHKTTVIFTCSQECRSVRSKNRLLTSLRLFLHILCIPHTT